MPPKDIYICATCKDTCVCPYCKGHGCEMCLNTRLCPVCCDVRAASRAIRQEQYATARSQAVEQKKGR